MFILRVLWSLEELDISPKNCSRRKIKVLPGENAHGLSVSKGKYGTARKKNGDFGVKEPRNSENV